MIRNDTILSYMEVCNSIYNLHLFRHRAKQETNRTPEKKIEWDHDIFKKVPTKGWKVGIDPEKTKFVSGFDMGSEDLSTIVIRKIES